MIVVADTSPLNYLILLGHSEFLPELYGRVLVPDAVLTEMQHADAPAEVRTWAATPPTWLERTPVETLDASLAVELGKGEREAISLALELHADAFVIFTIVSFPRNNNVETARLKHCCYVSIAGHPVARYKWNNQRMKITKCPSHL